METTSEMTMTVLDRALVAGDAGRVTGERQERPDPEVPEKARRRSYTAQYKLDVVAEYDATAIGEEGAVLRREGLCSSHVIEWRRARDASALTGLARPRSRPAADPRDAQIARLTREKARLEQELAKARFVVDVQAKLQALLERISEGADTGPGSRPCPTRPSPCWPGGSAPGPRARRRASRRPAGTGGTAPALPRCGPRRCRTATGHSPAR